MEGDLFPVYLMMPIGSYVEIRIPASVFMNIQDMEFGVGWLVFLDVLDVRLTLQM